MYPIILSPYLELTCVYVCRCTDDFNGAQLKAVAVESGMIALRREAVKIKHEDFMEAINVVAAKKKGSLDYYA